MPPVDAAAALAQTRPTRRHRIGAARRRVAGARRRCASRRRSSSERSRRSHRRAACARSRRSWSRRRRPPCAAPARACGMLRMWWPTAADNRHNGTDNRNNGTDNRYNGTDNRNNGTDNRNNGTDNRNNGTDNRNNGTDNRYNGTDNRNNGTDNRYNGAVIANNSTDYREHRPRSSILRDRSPPNSAPLVGRLALTRASPDSCARPRAYTPARPNAPPPPNQPTNANSCTQSRGSAARARAANKPCRPSARWVGHVGFRACPSACGGPGLRRGGTGPRQGWHWPACGMALARGMGGTGP